MTIEEAKQILVNAGFKVCSGASFEDERMIYVSSVDSDRRCYGHPMFEVQFSKVTGWLSVTNCKPKRLVL